MPKYYGQILNGKPAYNQPDLYAKWCEKNEGLFFETKLSVVGKTKDPKSSAQLGYYWGLLLPEIHQQLLAEGFTVPIAAFGIEKEIPITKDDAHEILTALCGRVGEDGQAKRLSEMNFLETMRFIDNVLKFAIAHLGMNGEALKARRPAA